LEKLKKEYNIIDKFHSLIKKDGNINIVEKLDKIDNYYVGKIEVRYLNEVIQFEIKIPLSYPLTHPNSDNISIIFKNKYLIGLNHINLDGSVCFHPDKDDDLERKFSYELLCLKQWIRDYYIFKKEDENYTYLIHQTEQNCINKLYYTNTKTNFKKHEYGAFSYSIFSDEKIGEKKFPVKKLFRLGFDDYDSDKWSDSFIKILKSKTCKKGLFYFIEDEPLNKEALGRKGIEHWHELEAYFKPEFVDFLLNGLKHEFGSNFYYENSLLLILGYKIPNKESYEEHWDLIRIQKNNIPIEYSKIPKKQQTSSGKRFVSQLNNKRVNWGSTENLDYNRFFGRGKLVEEITNSKILIIGCGALGSSLAEILVRSGARNLVLEDFDTIKGGNLCRANYDLKNMIYYKTDSLSKNLLSISPFVSINSISVKLNSFDIEKVKSVFNENIDIIFDCSTDPEVTYIIDKIDFKGKVFSFAITNHAKSFVSISGKNITQQAKTIFDLIENDPPSFYEGTGCGYPTFEANFNDINALLNLGLKVVNDKFLKGEKNETFIISPSFKNSLSINIDEFEFYNCDSSEGSIHISRKAILTIKELLHYYFPNEFGGVFIGYRSDKNIIITDVLIPDSYKNGKTVFVRHPGTLNERLSTIHEETNGKINYIGEWHSHPNGSASPSLTDINAMKEISNDLKINNPNPILMISSVTKTSFVKDIYFFEQNKLKKYE
jgi:integrative and conjugative element protein (TIGR02256 family)